LDYASPNRGTGLAIVCQIGPSNQKTPAKTGGTLVNRGWSLGSDNRVFGVNCCSSRGLTENLAIGAGIAERMFQISAI
jgi:hypothetical protein